MCLYVLKGRRICQGTADTTGVCKFTTVGEVDDIGGTAFGRLTVAILWDGGLLSICAGASDFISPVECADVPASRDVFNQLADSTEYGPLAIAFKER